MGLGAGIELAVREGALREVVLVIAHELLQIDGGQRLQVHDAFRNEALGHVHGPIGSQVALDGDM